MTRLALGSVLVVVALGTALYAVQSGTQKSESPAPREAMESPAQITDVDDVRQKDSPLQHDTERVEARQPAGTTPESFRKQPLSVAEAKYLSALYGEPADDAYEYLREFAVGGDSDSQYFLSELIEYCLSLLNRYEGGDRAEMERELRALLRIDVALYESSVANFNQHYAQYERCERIGRHDFLVSEGKHWYDEAFGSRHPIALAEAGVALFMQSVAGESREYAKALVREALAQSKRQVVIEAASNVALRAMTQPDPVEMAAWAVLYCEYNGCEELSPTSRSACEVHPDAFPCFEGATEWDFLIAQYGEHFDAARARAEQLREAIDNRRWAEVHLANGRTM